MTAPHVGRASSGHVIEDACPCPKAPCGLVDQGVTDPDCQHHPISRAKTIRQGHPADQCPGPAAAATCDDCATCDTPCDCPGCGTPAPAGQDVYQVAAEASLAVEVPRLRAHPDWMRDAVANCVADATFRAAVDAAVRHTEQRIRDHYATSAEAVIQDAEARVRNLRAALDATRAERDAQAEAYRQLAGDLPELGRLVRELVEALREVGGAAWTAGYGAGRDDEAAGLPIRTSGGTRPETGPGTPWTGPGGAVVPEATPDGLRDAEGRCAMNGAAVAREIRAAVRATYAEHPPAATRDVPVTSTGRSTPTEGAPE